MTTRSSRHCRLSLPCRSASSRMYSTPQSSSSQSVAGVEREVAGRLLDRAPFSGHIVNLIFACRSNGGTASDCEGRPRARSDACR